MSRLLLALLLAMLTALGAPAPVPAAESPPVIAMVLWRGWTKAEDGFRDGVRQAYPDARIVVHDAEKDPARLARALAEIRACPPRVVYTFGTTVTQAALERLGGIPVVYNAVNRPVEAGIIRDWASSGRSATGVSNQVPIINQLKTFRKAHAFRRLGIVYNPLEVNSVIQRDVVRRLRQELGFDLVELPLAVAAPSGPVSIGGVERIIGDAARRVDGVYFPADSLVKSHGGALVRAAHRARLPTLAALDEMVREDGAMLGVVADYYQLGRLSAAKAIRIVEGARPTDIPSSLPDAFQVLVNLKAAREVGVQIPLALLLVSDQIVRR